MSRLPTYTGTCSRPECTRPAKARGMCLTHYEVWRRNFPGDLRAADTHKEVLDAMPRTRAQLQVHTGLSATRIVQILRELRDAEPEKLAHIAGFNPPKGHRGNWIAVYARGNKPDAVLSEEDVREHARAVRRRQYEARVAKQNEQRAADAALVERVRPGLVYADIFNLAGRRVLEQGRPQC